MADSGLESRSDDITRASRTWVDSAHLAGTPTKKGGVWAGGTALLMIARLEEGALALAEYRGPFSRLFLEGQGGSKNLSSSGC
jgi:hypothetical protein